MKIGFIGGGNMGTAMLGGILRKEIYKKEEIIVSDLSPERLSYIKEKLGVETTSDNKEVAKAAVIIVLSIKPQFYEEVLTEVRDAFTPEKNRSGYSAGENTFLAGRKMCGSCENLSVNAEHSGTGGRRNDGSLSQWTGHRGRRETDLRDYRQLRKDGSSPRTSAGCCGRGERKLSGLCIYVYRGHG